MITDTEKVTKQPKDGMNLTLTIDKRLQTYLESLVSQADKNYQPVQMTAMLLILKRETLLRQHNVQHITQQQKRVLMFNGTIY